MTEPHFTVFGVTFSWEWAVLYMAVGLGCFLVTRVVTTSKSALSRDIDVEVPIARPLQALPMWCLAWPLCLSMTVIEMHREAPEKS